MVLANLAGLGRRYKTDLAKIWTTSRERGVERVAGAARFGHLLRTPTPYLTDLLAVVGLASRVAAGG